MELRPFIKQMELQAQTINSLAQGVSDEQARWKPDRESWSILEVVNHLCDEEREDFRVRLDIILHHPERSFPPIDPQGWVTSREYNSRDLGESLGSFMAERENSLQWLECLESPNWDAKVPAPWGELSAGQMYAAWVAHDLLHIRQLIELKWAYTQIQVRPYSTQYAGEW